MERTSLGKLPGEKIENVTATKAVSVSGLHIPPTVVSAHKRMRGGFGGFLAGDPPNTITIWDTFLPFCLPDGFITFRRR
jgi:hypothetical protein